MKNFASGLLLAVSSNAIKLQAESEMPFGFWNIFGGHDHKCEGDACHLDFESHQEQFKQDDPKFNQWNPDFASMSSFKPAVEVPDFRAYIPTDPINEITERQSSKKKSKSELLDTFGFDYVTAPEEKEKEEEAADEGEDEEEEDLEVPETSGEDNSYGYSPKIQDEGDTEVCNPWEVCAKPDEKEDEEEEEEADLEVESDLEVNSTKPSYKPSYSSSKVFNPWATEPEAEEEEEEADKDDGDSADSESDEDEEEDLEVETETDNKKSSYNPWNRPSYAPPQIAGPPPSPFNSFFSWF